MRSHPAHRKITADEFLAMHLGIDERFELHDGVVYMMTGGTQGHSWVKGNIFAWLRTRLRGSGCRPYDTDMALRIGEHDVRYPDISIYCDDTIEDPLTDAKALDNPTVLIEVLSPSTATFDQSGKLEEYQAMPSVRTIAFVDPMQQLCRAIERTDDGWSEGTFSGHAGIQVPALGFTIPHDEIFARD